MSKSKLQLVGVTAMWIASKYEEMYAPEVRALEYFECRHTWPVESSNISSVGRKICLMNIG